MLTIRGPRASTRCRQREWIGASQVTPLSDRVKQRFGLAFTSGSSSQACGKASISFA